MDITDEHLRHVLIYEFYRQGATQDANAAEAARNINAVYGENTIGDSTARKFFQKFKQNDFTTAEGKITGRPDTFPDSDVEEVLEMNPWATQEEIAAELGVDQSTISRRLKRMDKVAKSGVLVPKDLNFNQKLERGIIGRINSTRFRRNPRFLNHLLVADQTPVFVKNYKKKHAWVDRGQKAPRTERPQKSKKLTLCIFYDSEGMLFWELRDGSVDGQIYANQLREVREAIIRGRRRGNNRKVIILHDNYRPHASQHALNVMAEFGWEILVHPAYSPDGNPVDYSFNRGLKAYQGNKKYQDEEELADDIEAYINSKEGTDFYRNSIQQLPQRWEYWYENEGDYFPD